MRATWRNKVVAIEFQPLIERALSRLSHYAVDRARMRKYYLGEQGNPYLTARNLERYGTLFREFRENLCAPVVDATASRLILEAVQSGDKATDQAITAALAFNDLGSRQRSVHTDALIMGRAWIICWPDERRRIRAHFNRGDVVEGVWDPDDETRLIAAVKRWRSLDAEGKPSLRTTVYYGDRAERFHGDGWHPYDADGEPSVQPHRMGRVPVVPFGGGRSDLADVVPIQDALNKASYDLLVGMEFTAMQQRYVTGLDQVEYDPATGRMRDPFGPGGLWIVGNPDAKFGTLEAGDLAQMGGVSDSWRQAAARVARVPLHYLVQGGEFPSGEALKTAEAPFAAKLASLAEEFGESWERLARLLVGLDDDVVLQAVWRDTTPRNEVDRWNVAATKHMLGVSRRQILLEMGYGTETVDRILAERADEDAEREAQRARAAWLGPALPPTGGL